MSEFYIYISLFAVILVDQNCSFPFTYNGGLYYSCVENMTDVSTAEEPLACLNVIATPVICDSPGRLYSADQ